uniref:Uncharacterized protein n=1 Tax=Panagrolaimus superbus TaxID=310955 RepID=A0A914Y9Q4_9BILA
MGNGSSNDRDRGERSSPPQRQLSFRRDGFQRTVSNGLDNCFEGNQTYDKEVRTRIHEWHHERSANTHEKNGNYEAAKNDKFNAERHYRTRNDIPQSRDENGKFKKDEYIQQREEREKAEKK